MRRAMGILGIVALALGLTGSSASAWNIQQFQVPADFITGGGWYIIQSPNFDSLTRTGGVGAIPPGTRANFGWHGGVKNGQWWGNGNYIDHGTGLHIHSVSVTGYVCASGTATAGAGGCSTDIPNEEDHMPAGTRDVCGTARVNVNSITYSYRVRMKDSTKHPFGDGFGITLFDPSGNLVYGTFGSLGSPTPGGGSIQLHKHNPSNTAPTTTPVCPIDFFTANAPVLTQQP